MDRQELFQVLVPKLLQLEPNSFLPLVNSGNKLLHHQTVKAAYEIVEVALPITLDSATLMVPPKVDAVLKNPQLGEWTRTIRFHQAPSSDERPAEKQTVCILDIHGERRNAVWTIASNLIRCCPNVKILEWDTTFGVGGSLWEAVASLKDLKHLSIGHPPLHPLQDPNRPSTLTCPRITPRLQLLITPHLPLKTENEKRNTLYMLTRETVVGNGEWGLGAGWENLESLQIGPLSETGAKTIANHLTLLSMHPASLISIAIETQFLDTLLCSSIGRVGALGLLSHIEISTTGTRLTSECINTIVSGCVMLESLKLIGVDGHLSKDTWSIIEEWPQSFISLEIVIPEYSKRFSWILDHLESIHHVPFKQLRHFAIRRGVHPLNLLPFSLPNEPSPPSVQSDMALCAIPETVLQAILDNGKQLRSLCVNWWEINQEGLLSVMANLTQIETLEVALEAPFSQALNISNACSKLPLKHLTITSNPTIYPTSPSGKLKIDYVVIPDSLPVLLKDEISKTDPHLPDPRDLKKFARRLPELETLEWAGQGGRGRWRFNRRSPQSSLIGITFAHSALLTQNVWEQCQGSPPRLYGEIVETPSSSQALEIPSTSSTPSHTLDRTMSTGTDDSTKISSSGKSSVEELVISHPASDEDDISPWIEPETAPALTTPQKINFGSYRDLRTPKTVKQVVLPFHINSRNNKEVKNNSLQRGTASLLPNTGLSPPSLPAHHRTGSIKHWYSRSQISSDPKPEIIAPRIIPGSGGRQSVPVDTIGKGLKKALPTAEKAEQHCKERKEEKKEMQGVKAKNESGWTVVGGQKSKANKTDQAKKK